MENTIENIEVEEREPEIDQEKFKEAMDEFCRLVWECSQLETDEEKQAYAIGRDMPVIDLIIESGKEQFDCEEDKNDVKVIMEELLIMLARTLNRMTEKNRNEFKEIFIDGKNED